MVLSWLLFTCVNSANPYSKPVQYTPIYYVSIALWAGGPEPDRQTQGKHILRLVMSSVYLVYHPPLDVKIKKVCQEITDIETCSGQKANHCLDNDNNNHTLTLYHMQIPPIPVLCE